MPIGERIKARRAALGLTQVGLAHAIKVAPMTISKWERGVMDPALSSIVPLADALECSVGWLVRGEGPEPHPAEGSLGATGTDGV